MSQLWNHRGRRGVITTMTSICPRLAAATALTFFVLLVTAAPTAAAIRLDFDPPAASPGATAVATAVDQSMVMIPSGRLQLFLAASQQVADEATGPDDPRLMVIGDLVADKTCTGRLSFTVPDLAAGKYVVVAHCAECRPNMIFGSTCSPEPALAEKARHRGTLFSVGTFRVLKGASLPRTGTPVLPAVRLGALLCLLGAILYLLRRTMSQP